MEAPAGLAHFNMRIAVASCWKYRDTWPGFFGLSKKHWADCPYRQILLTDSIGNHRDELFDGIDWVESGNKSWCAIVATFAAEMDDQPILLMLDDLFLTGPPNQEMIDHALKILERDNVGAVRLYPCPGANEEAGDPYFGRVARHTQYRNSTLATIWRPSY